MVSVGRAEQRDRPAEEAAKIVARLLADKIGDRLRSRLYELTETISIRGIPDYRNKNNQSSSYVI